MKSDLFKSRVFYGVLMAIGGGLLFGSKILPLRIFGGGAAALATWQRGVGAEAEAISSGSGRTCPAARGER